MERLIIDCSTGKKTRVLLSDEERVNRLQEIEQAKQSVQLEKEKKDKRDLAIGRLKSKAKNDPNLADLLELIL